MTQDVKAAILKNESMGLNGDEIAFYDALAERPQVLQEMSDKMLKCLTIELTAKLRQSSSFDWQVRESVRAQMRLLIKRLLRKFKYPPESQESAFEMVIKQAERLSEQWTESCKTLS